MNFRVPKTPFLLMLGFAVLLSGCSPAPGQAAPPTAAAPQETVTVTLSAAKSLSECLPEVAELYAQSHPEVKVEFNFGSSGSMRQQIEQGAAVDLYIPAGEKDLKALKEGGFLVDASIVNILGNQLVLVVPANSSLEMKGFSDLINDRVKQVAVGEPGSVPAGKYAQEAFTSLGILDVVKSKVVYAKDVREVLAWTATGNVDAGVVYLTEAMASDQVKILAKAEEKSHSPIVYPGAVLKESKHPQEAQGFLDYLSSDGAKSLFEKYGYTFLAE